uniref:Peptidoglycan recognition protein family domain-containing protein n=1 Tax=Strigamia maritima TaxID=126957 RepID=T1J1Y8_STRMM
MMVHHTSGGSCKTTEACKKLIKKIETYEMTEQHAKEILSHFFIGGDGQIYEGRGWYYPDEYIPGKGLSLSISFIGDYNKHDAPANMLEAFDKFAQCFMKKVSGYCNHIFSVHSDHRCTDCPGSHLKAQLKKMKYYDRSKNTRPCERHKAYVQHFYSDYKDSVHRTNFKYSAKATHKRIFHKLESSNTKNLYTKA